MGSSWYLQREVLGMKKKFAKLKKQGGERLENFGSGKIFGLLLVQIWGKQDLSWWGGRIYCAVQKEKVCGHVTMVAKFLGEFAALSTNTRSLVPSRPRGFQMWRSLSKHANSKVQKRTMKHGNTQNGSKSSLCTDPPPSPQEKSEKGSLLKFFLRGGGSVHRLIEIHQSQITVS